MDSAIAGLDFAKCEREQPKIRKELGLLEEPPDDEPDVPSCDTRGRGVVQETPMFPMSNEVFLQKGMPLGHKDASATMEEECFGIGKFAVETIKGQSGLAVGVARLDMHILTINLTGVNGLAWVDRDVHKLLLNFCKKIWTKLSRVLPLRLRFGLTLRISCPSYGTVVAWKAKASITTVFLPIS
jgi:hypothetical protein